MNTQSNKTSTNQDQLDAILLHCFKLLQTGLYTKKSIIDSTGVSAYRFNKYLKKRQIEADKNQYKLF
jgi:hypothetical protein